MSQGSVKINRKRPSSIKTNKEIISMPQEHVNQPTKTNPRVVSVIKIQDKVLGQQIATKKKIESLKRCLEEEELKEVRDKPKILEKSRILAEKAEKKLMQQYSEIKEVKNAQNTENDFMQVQPDLNNKSVTRVKMIIEKVVQSKTPSKSQNITKSLLNLSVLERNEV